MSNPYIHLKEYEKSEIDYNKFCTLFELEKKKGKAKKLQLNQIMQYVDLVQQNRKILIRKIYEDNEIQFVESQGKFTTYIENFLMENLYDLKNINESFVVLTHRDILENVYMVNQDYFKGKFCPYLFIDKIKMKINKSDCPSEQYLFNKVIDDSDIFFSSSYRLLKRVIYDSLCSMENRSLIQKNKTFVLYKNEEDEDGFFTSERYNCTDDDISRILTIQHKSIKEFNDSADEWDNGKKKYFVKDIKWISMLYPKQKKEFFKILNNNLKEEFKIEGYNAYSTAWKLNLADKSCFDYEIKKLNYYRLNKNIQDKLLSASDLEIIGNTLNQQFIDIFIKLK